MCGIAGSLSYHDEPLDLNRACHDMIARLSHRGPDYCQVNDLGNLQLAHSRLSIIDRQAQSHQPMATPDKRYWISFNGEIYNYIELRQELIQLGHVFVTEGDTEVVLTAWQQWGVEALQKLVGMFAIAIWDAVTQQLTLIRDRMGEKPLYYAHPLSQGSTREGVLFASELKALSRHPLFVKKINPQAINQYLSLNYILTDHCIYQHAKKLPPAHYVIFEKGKAAEPVCYWSLADHFNQAHEKRPLSDYMDEWRALFNTTIKGQLRSDVKYGAYLSGGLDSSAISAAMADVVRQTSLPAINTYSIDFDEAGFSEAVHSRYVAQYLSVNHQIQKLTIDSSADLIRAMSCYGEPFADTSAIPCFFLAKYARAHATVCLSGDGGDELFAGYETYAADKVLNSVRYLPKWFFKCASKLVNKLYPPSFGKVGFDYKLKQFLYGAQFDYKRAHYAWRTIFSEAEKKELCKKELYDAFANDPYEDYQKYFAEVAESDRLNQFLYVDMKTWLVDDILLKVDRSSMAHSLEVRAPFLDHRLVEFAARLPTRLKLKGSSKKYFLKKSQESILPDAIINRKKSGFNAPVSHWLFDGHDELVHGLVFSDKMHELFDRDYMDNLWQRHQSKVEDNSLKLFGLMNFGLWLQNNT